MLSPVAHARHLKGHDVGAPGWSRRSTFFFTICGVLAGEAVIELGVLLLAVAGTAS